MKPKDDYAFPRSNMSWAPGMELRDWFAGMALQDFLASRSGFVDYDQAAVTAYGYADAMIEHRNKEQDQ